MSNKTISRICHFVSAFILLAAGIGVIIGFTPSLPVVLGLCAVFIASALFYGLNHRGERDRYTLNLLVIFAILLVIIIGSMALGETLLLMTIIITMALAIGSLIMAAYSYI